MAFRSAEPPLHIHHRKDEAWYILDGKMTFYVGDAVIEAIAGCFAFAPRGIPHTFTVDVEPTRVLVFASSAGFEHFALKLREQARGDTPPAGLAIPGPEGWVRSRSVTASRSWGSRPGAANGTIWLPGSGRVTWGRQAISHAAQGLQICPPRAARQAGRGTAPEWRQCAPDS